MNISVVVISKNEEKNIGSCLKSVDFADETIVIDDFSEDKTVQIAKGLGAKVYKRRLKRDFSAQRNFGMDKAQGRWILFVDADERVSDELREEILKVIKDIETLGYYLIRRDQLFGKTLRFGEFSKFGAFGNARILRLGRKGAGRWRRVVHEYWDIKGKCKTLKEELLHFPHPTLTEFINNINFFSSLHAKAILSEGKKVGLAKIIIWPGGKFIYNMIFRLGFLDGMEGFVVSLIMSFNSFLAWSKAWANQRQHIWEKN